MEGDVLLIVADPGGWPAWVCCCCCNGVSDGALCETLLQEAKKDRREKEHVSSLNGKKF